MKFTYTKSNNRLVVSEALATKQARGVTPTLRDHSAFEDFIKTKNTKAALEMIAKYSVNLVYGQTRRGKPIGNTYFAFDPEVPLSPLELAAIFSEEDIFIAIMRRANSASKILMRKGSFGGEFHFPLCLASHFLGVRAIHEAVRLGGAISPRYGLLAAVRGGHLGNTMYFTQNFPEEVYDHPFSPSILTESITVGNNELIFEHLVDFIEEKRVSTYHVSPLAQLLHHLAAKPGSACNFGRIAHKLSSHLLMAGGGLNNIPLHIAASYGMAKECEKILNVVPRCSIIKNIDGNTPLMEACLSGSTQTARTLMAADIHRSVTVQNNKGQLPLHIAILTGNRELALLLCYEYKEGLLIKDAENRAPIDLEEFGPMASVLSAFL